MASWCDLAEDLLVSIVNRLESRFDIKRFRAVCRSWRFSVPPPPQLASFPPIVCRRFKSHGDPTHLNLQLFEIVVCCLQQVTTGKQWLVRVRQRADGQVEIKDPFGRSHDQKVIINSLNCRISEITKLYHTYDMNHDIPICDCNLIYPIGASMDDDNNCGTSGGFMLCDGTIHSTFDNSYMLKYRGKLYENRRCLSINIHDASNYNSYDPIDEIYAPVISPWTTNRYYFMSLGDHLFLVNKADVPARQYAFLKNEAQRNPFSSDGIKFSSKNYIDVFKVVMGEDGYLKLVEVTDLGDRALILCQDHIYSVSVQEFAGIQKGFIYFLDTPVVPDAHEEEKTVVWGFDLEKGTLSHGLHCFDMPA